MLDCRSKGPRFDPRPGHENFLRVRDTMIRLISSNYPCLEHIFMVPKVFEPLKFYCIFFNIREYFEMSVFEISKN